MKEKDFEGNVKAYLARLDKRQLESFAPFETLIYGCREGLDLQIMALRDGKDTGPLTYESIRGLVLLNQDSAPSKNATGASAIKITLHHFSSVDVNDRDSLMTLTLNYIWKEMHCSAVRVNLYHLKDENGSLRADVDIKKLLKEHKFKWKTVKNDTATGSR